MNYYDMEKFNKTARRVIDTAIETAEDYRYGQYKYVGTEHLLLAFTMSSLTINLNLSNDEYAKLQKKVFDNSYHGDLDDSRIELSETMQKILNPPSNITTGYLNTNYLLARIIQDTECNAYKYLTEIGYNIASLEEKLYKASPEYVTLSPDKIEKIALRNTYTLKIEDKNFDIDSCAENMNLAYINGKYDKCVNRNNEINRICEILMRKNKNNPILLGKAGVGKTAVVEGLTEKMIMLRKKYPDHPLANKIILNLNLTSMIAGTKYRGDFEDKLNNIIKIAKEYPVILFIDEIHMITDLNGSKTEGTTDMAQMLKQPLSRGDISVIGATTEEEYDKIAKDKALGRRFSPVIIKEFSKTAMKSILKTISETYSNYHKIIITDDVMTDALDYCEEFYESKVYPDKLIDIIDETAARVRLNNYDEKNPKITSDDIKRTVFNQTGKIIV